MEDLLYQISKKMAKEFMELEVEDWSTDRQTDRQIGSLCK